MAESKQPAPKPASQEKPIVAWQAKEFADYDRNKRWYVLVAVVGVLLTVGALVIQQWLTAVVFALATFVVMRHAGDKPRTVSYGISRLGVTVDDTFYPFSELKQYWIVYNPPVRTVSFQRTSRFKPIIKMNMGEVDPDAIRAAVKDHLPELPKQGEDFIDKFSRFIRL